jgi:transcriptional antiterminator RfaH
MSANQWYLIYTRPNQERKVFNELSLKNIETFFPFRKVVRTWSDRKKCVDTPLFPSYIFVFLRDISEYYDSLTIPGALYFVRTGKEIARVSETVVNNLKLTAAWAQDVEVSTHYFQPGEQVIIQSGALTGLRCEVVKLDARKKILVRVELLNRSILATFPSEYLVSAYTCI